MTGDALFRNNKLVDKLFAAHKFNEIILHNQNCLINEYIINFKLKNNLNHTFFLSLTLVDLHY